jgi:hypothetical protein
MYRQEKYVRVGNTLITKHAIQRLWERYGLLPTEVDWDALCVPEDSRQHLLMLKTAKGELKVVVERMSEDGRRFVSDGKPVVVSVLSPYQKWYGDRSRKHGKSRKHSRREH